MHKLSLKIHTLAALLLVVLVAIAYAPILGVPFLSDDYGVIEKIVLPGGGTDWARVLGDFRGPLFGFRAMYRPLYTLSFALDYSLFGTWALPYHLTNLVLHAISSFFVYLVALELFRGEWRLGAAITAGALFALHPIHPESVTWIAGRVDLICAVFFLPALLFFLRWMRAGNSLYLALALAAFALSLMAKEMAVTLPGLLLLVALYCGKGLRGSVLRVLPFAVLLGAYLLFRYYILSELETNQILARDAGVLEILQGFVYRTLHMFVPLNLGVISIPWLKQFLNSAFFFWPLLIVVLLLLVRSRNKLPLLAFGLYTLSLVPVLPALTRTDPLLTTSRWLYIPSAFLSILVAGLVWAAMENYRCWRLPVAVVVCGTFLAMLLANNWVWVQAGELGEELAGQSRAPEFPVKYKGAHVFIGPGLWLEAHRPPFREEEDLARLRITGTVGRVNTEEERFALKWGGGARTSISFDPEVTITRGEDGRTDLEDIKTGQSVQVVFEVSQDQENLARLIRLKEGGGARRG